MKDVHMLNALFVTLFFLMPLFFIWQIRLAGEQLNRISLVNFVFVALIAFSYLGLFPLYFHLDSYRYETGVTDQLLIFRVLVLSSINIVFFLFGVIFFRKIFGLSSSYLKEKNVVTLARAEVILLIGLLFVSCTVFLIYISQVAHVAIWDLYVYGAKTGKVLTTQVLISRSEMTNGFPKYHWYRFGMHELSSFLVFTVFATWLSTRRMYLLIVFLILLAYSAFIALMSTEKAPIVWLFLGLFLVYLLTKKNGYISLSKIFFLAGGLVIGIGMMDLVVMDTEGGIVGSALAAMSRAFAGAISSAYFYLQYFPEHRDFLMGLTLPNPRGILPFEPVNFTAEVMNWRFPEYLNKGIIGTMPTVFWGESYANFGYVGIPIIAFLVGVIVAFFAYIVSRGPFTPITIGYCVWLMLSLKDLSITGFSFYVANISFICMLIVFLMSLFIHKKLDK